MNSELLITHRTSETGPVLQIISIETNAIREIFFPGLIGIETLQATESSVLISPRGVAAVFVLDLQMMSIRVLPTGLTKIFLSGGLILGVENAGRLYIDGPTPHYVDLNLRNPEMFAVEDR
jgi:hypothetical protein